MMINVSLAAPIRNPSVTTQSVKKVPDTSHKSGPPAWITLSNHGQSK